MTRAPSNPRDASSLETLRLLAEQAARAGGAVARASFGRVGRVRRKADRSEVTDADEAAQRAVFAAIRSRRPDDAFIGEESLTPETRRDEHDQSDPRPDENRDAELCWVVDPIDGTRNYVRGIPLYCCSVAVMTEGRPIAGAIYDPTRDVMYSGDEKHGARVDDQVVAFAADGPERVPGSAQTPIVAIPSTRHREAHEIVHDWVDRLVVRNLGSTALHLALLAAGRLDGVLATNCRLWDIAAGALLVTAAGGVITSPYGQPLFPIDVTRYAGEDIPCLGAHRDLHARLIVSPSN